MIYHNRHTFVWNSISIPTSRDNYTLNVQLPGRAQPRHVYVTRDLPYTWREDHASRLDRSRHSGENVSVTPLASFSARRNEYDIFAASIVSKDNVCVNSIFFHRYNRCTTGGIARTADESWSFFFCSVTEIGTDVLRLSIKNNRLSRWSKKYNAGSLIFGKFPIKIAVEDYVQKLNW